MSDVYNSALEYFSKDPFYEYEREHALKYPGELIYCYENQIPFSHFQEWSKLQDLLNDKVSYDDYFLVATAFTKLNLLEIDPQDFSKVGDIRELLQRWHEPEQEKPTLFSRFRAAVSRFFDRGNPSDVPSPSKQPSPFSDHGAAINSDYTESKKHYSQDTDLDIDKHYPNHAEELVYCHQHDCSFIDFEMWCKYQDLLGEKIGYDEYSLLDAGIRTNILSVSEADKGFVYELRHHLNLLRNDGDRNKQDHVQPRKPPLSDRINSAAARSSSANTVGNVKNKVTEPDHTYHLAGKKGRENVE